MSMPPQLGPSYLYVGNFKADKTGKNLELEPGSVSPVRNVVLIGELTFRPAEGAAAGTKPAGKPATWMPDPDGLLRPLSGVNGNARGATVKFWSDSAKVRLVPSDIVLGAWAKDNDKWPEQLLQAVGAEVKSEAITIEEMPIRKRHLRPPVSDSQDPDERAYAASYDQLTDSSPPRAGIVLARLRAVVLITSDPTLAIEMVTLRPVNGGADIGAKKSGNSWVVVGTQQKLPAGLYKIDVTLKPKARSGNEAFQKNGYTLHEILRFEITNPFGDVDLVCIDPISLEEAVLAQFPVLYEHRVKAAVKRAYFPGQEVNTDSFPTALKFQVDRLKWAHGKAKLGVGVLNAESTTAAGKLIGKALYDSFDSDDPVVKRLKSTVDLGFGIRESLESWDAVTKALEVDPKQLEGMRRLLLESKELTAFKKYAFWKYASKQLIEEKVMVFDLANAEKNALVLKAGIPEKRTRIQSALGKSGKAIEKGIAVVGTALELAQAAVAFAEMFSAREDAKLLASELKRLATDVDKVLKRGASREALANLERMRAAAVAAGLGAEEAEGKALVAALDLALGALSLAGIGGPALALVAFVRGASGLMMDAGELLDSCLLQGAIKDHFATQMRSYELARASRVNQELLPPSVQNGGVDDLHAQYVLRAEALNGLVRLLMRAAVYAETQDQYYGLVKAMEVEEYVKQIVLGSGWQFPLRPSVPISMDSVWLQQRHHYLAEAATNTIGDMLGYKKPLKLVAETLIPHIAIPLAFAQEVLAGSAKAAYHASFPIHRFEAERFEEFVQAFKPAWKELNAFNIAYSCVYWRPKDAKPDAEWKPVCPSGTILPSKTHKISPLDQVRIILVMKEKAVPQGQYPVKLRLIRCDGWNVDGPEYQEIMRPLQAEELLATEKQFSGAVGIVLYPHYCFGAQTIPGIKPLVSKYWRAGEVPTHLDDMRYSIQAIFGKESSGPLLDIGTNGGKPLVSQTVTKLLPQANMLKVDEFRVGFSGCDADEAKLYNVSFLSRQSSDKEYPQIFNESEGAKAGAEPVYGRVGGEKWRLATHHEDANRVWPNYNWTDPVEFVLVVWASKLSHRDAENEGIEWDRINVKTKLVQFGSASNAWWSHDGPEYDSNLEYVGMLHRQGKYMANEGSQKPTFARGYIEEFSHKWNDKHAHAVRGTGKEVAQWADEVLTNPEELHKLAWAIDPTGSAGVYSYYIYAAHFRLDYYTPAGVRTEALRPFGRVLTNRSPVPRDGDDYYRISLRDIRTTGNTGLTWPKVEGFAPPDYASGKDEGRVFSRRPEFEFHFRAPVANDPRVPWAGSGDAEEWITKKATMRHPGIEIALQPKPAGDKG